MCITTTHTHVAPNLFKGCYMKLLLSVFLGIFSLFSVRTAQAKVFQDLPHIELGPNLTILSQDQSQSAEWVSGMTGLIGNHVHYESQLLNLPSEKNIAALQIETRINLEPWQLLKSFEGTTAKHTWQVIDIPNHDFFTYEVRTKAIIGKEGGRQEVIGGNLKLVMKRQRPALLVNEEKSEWGFSDLTIPNTKQCGRPHFYLNHPISIEIRDYVFLHSNLGITLEKYNLESLVKHYDVNIAITTSFSISNTELSNIPCSPRESFKFWIRRIDRFFYLEEYTKDFLYRDVPTGGHAMLESVSWDIKTTSPKNCYGDR